MLGRRAELMEIDSERTDRVKQTGHFSFGGSRHRGRRSRDIDTVYLQGEKESTTNVPEHGMTVQGEKESSLNSLSIRRCTI